MKRVAIIGSSGTGKSTFAVKLGQQSGLPLIHLDQYFHDSKYDYENNKPAWHSRADSFVQKDKWIIDGNYGKTMAKRLERADTIYYFDMPTYIALKGIVHRWFADPSKRAGVPGDWQEHPSWSFFWYVLRFRHHYAQGTWELLRRNKDKKIVVFKNHRQVDVYLRYFGSHMSEAGINQTVLDEFEKIDDSMWQ